MLTPAFAAETKLPRTITLTGHGEVRMAPDRATVSVGVQSARPTLPPTPSQPTPKP